MHPYTAADDPASALEPDLAQARRFLELLDPDADRFTFQTFDDAEEKRGHLARVINGSLQEEAERLAGMNKAGAGVFITVNETDLQGRRAQNIRRVRAVFVDLDGAPVERVVGCTLTPHAIVESSPQKFHGYWLADGFPLDQFEPTQSAIAARFHGDTKVKDLPRVMRLPGFIHRKAEPFRTRILQIEEALPYPPAAILAEFPRRTSGDVGGPGKATSPDVWRKLAEGIEAGARNGSLTRIAGLLFRRLPEPLLAAALVLAFNEARCHPPLPAEEVQRILESLAAREMRRRGLTP